jgi:5-methylcytosine-specific restriction endonuclease McrA
VAAAGSDLGPDYLAPRRCLREPIPELFECAWLLDLAVGAHLDGDRALVLGLLNRTNSQIVRDYVESLWGAQASWPEQVHYKRLRPVPGLPERRQRATDPKPDRATKLATAARDGFQCRYCGIPVIPAEVRNAFKRDYPEANLWGKTNATQHAGFQALWLQFDHILPAALGGNADLNNMVIACSGCNYCKWHYHLDEMGLCNPLDFPAHKTSWDGLTRYLGGLENWKP